MFCPHVNRQFGTLAVAQGLAKTLRMRVETYSGSAPKGISGDWEEHNMRVARDFKRNRISVLACTNAFGMGIDKPNIRFTAHLGLPQTVEAFYQQAGRAGRDQHTAHCDIVLSVDHPRRARQLLDPNTPIETVIELVDDVEWDEADDVTRALYFHTRAFAGLDEDLQMVKHVLGRLGSIVPDKAVAFSWVGLSHGKHEGDAEKQASEKAVYHLVTLGVVRDYTLDWAKRELQLVLGDQEGDSMAVALGNYGRAYQVRRGDILQQEFARNAPADPTLRIVHGAKLLIEFIYETVELARRRGLSEMLQAASQAVTAINGSEVLKKRVLQYLTQTDWDVRLEEIGAKGGLGADALRLVLEEVVSSRHAEELRGAAARQLNSYPDQPAFLFLRAFAEACVTDPDWERVTEDVRAALAFGREKYGASEQDLATVVADLTSFVESRGRPGQRLVQSAILASGAGRPFQRELCGRLPPHLAVELVAPLMTRLRRTAIAHPHSGVTRHD